MKQFAITLLCGAMAGQAAAAEPIDDTFYCRSSAEGSPEVVMHARNGEVLVEVPDSGGRTQSYGKLEASPETYHSRREELGPDGRKLTVEFHLDRNTGKTQLDMTMESEGLAPVTVHHTGTCRDFDFPEA